MTELRLASASTIAEAQAVLERFLPRFNARFAVAARQPAPAWRPLDPALDLERRLAFRHTRTVARDNTVKYHWRTLQLAALTAADQLRRGEGRGAGAPRAGELAVRHQGETIPLAARPAPLRRAARAPLRAGARPCAGAHRLRRSAPVAVHPARRRTRLRQRHDRQRRCAHRPALADREPGGALACKAIQQALLQGLSMRATARLLGISRNTIRRYVRAGGPPGRQDAASSTEQRPPSRTFSLNR